MPIDESWTVRPPEGSKRLTGAEILEAAHRLSRYDSEAAALAEIKVVTGWGGKIRYLEVTVPELGPEDPALDGQVWGAGQALPPPQQAPTEPWFPGQ